MDTKELIYELNKILTLEHGHLGMYKSFMNYSDKDLRRTFRHFLDLEMEHVNKIQNILRNLGAKPSLLVEGGDIIGNMFGITINVADEFEAIKAFKVIEKKSHEGYVKFTTKLERENNILSNFIVEEITSSNQLESYLQYLWLNDRLKAPNCN
ncbi:ferritin-like domain-containing protein [Desulfosporosinus sp. SYSU MS00001]|uniref:ferritin-like domain-containing protein n=1 Tax=Desulfosporosinus sp. SYSU MS00001 TaxID=3416284 RepID=UPI003CEC0187